MKWKNAFYSCYLGSLIIVAHFFFLFSSTHAACTFPKKWHGEWFQSEAKERHIVINETSFDNKGSCYEPMTQPSDQYILESRTNEGKTCFLCLLINFNQENVISYKDTDCITQDQESSPATLCSNLDVNSPLYTMFRVDAKPIPCPFVNPPFVFYYMRGEETCQNPMSKISACADDSKLLLQYSACTDVKGSESTTEELTCIGTWKSGSSNYLVAKVHDSNERNFYESGKYICYIYEPISQGTANTGYKIGLSEASCNGLSSVNDGSTRMMLTREPVRHTNCKFPLWITKQNTWRALNSPDEYNFLSSNATRGTSRDESKIVCHSIESGEDLKYSYIVVKVITGCKVGYKCMLFQRRDEHIIEIQESPVVEDNYADICQPSRFDPTAFTPVTYTTANFPGRKCPILPKLTSIPESRACTDKVYHHVSIGCGPKPEQVEFKPPETCTNFSAVEFMCHGHWEAKKMNSTEVAGYIIASPLRRSDHKYICFSYTKKNDVYQLRVTAPTCYEPRAMFSFQLKSGGQCRSSDTYFDKNGAEDDDAVNIDSKCATLAISAFHFAVAYLLGVYIR